MAEKKIVLTGGRTLSYRMEPAEITNPLGVVIALLQEYIVTEDTEKNNGMICRLYKTKEGNWYDKNEEVTTEKKMILQQLKSAIDSDEIKK